MGLFDSLAKFGSDLVEHTQRQNSRQLREQSNAIRAITGEEPKIGIKTLREWEVSWEYIGILENLENITNSVGIYRARLNGEIVYIGRAIEYDNGGLRKRLSDYTRKSDSARTHESGQNMHQNANSLHIEIKITGTDENAANVARKLEQYFIGKDSPAWNKMYK
jgi:hypothetical protein